jgi:hypothetical protein
MLVAKKSQPTERLLVFAAAQAQASAQLDVTRSTGSTHFDAFATRHTSSPFRVIFRHRTASARPQVEFASACLTSPRHGVGKPDLPSSFTRAFTTDLQHFAYALDPVTGLHGHAAATAARTSATTAAFGHFDGFAQRMLASAGAQPPMINTPTSPSLKTPRMRMRYPFLPAVNGTPCHWISGDGGRV